MKIGNALRVGSTSFATLALSAALLLKRCHGFFDRFIWIVRNNVDWNNHFAINRLIAGKSDFHRSISDHPMKATNTRPLN